MFRADCCVLSIRASMNDQSLSDLEIDAEDRRTAGSMAWRHQW